MLRSWKEVGDNSLNPRGRETGNGQETPSAGTWRQASEDWDWPREERPVKRCLQDPCLRLIPQVRAARTYECLSTHETLTTINAFGARVKWLFYRLIVKPRASDMQHHVVGCEPRPNDRNISTRHIATLLRINELNSTFLKESNVKKLTFKALFEKKYSLLSMSEIILILQDILEKYSIISFLHTVYISFSYTCQ